MTIAIQQNWKVEDVLTDVTTAKLSDPTGTYGIRRLTPTQSDVVADGTAMTKVSTGTYRYEYDDSGDPAGSTYTAYIEFVYAGATYHLERDFNKPGAATYGITYTQIKTHIADWLGLGRNSEGAGSDWDTSEVYRLDEAIRHGYWRFIYNAILPGEKTAHQWSFMEPTTSFTTTASDYLYDLPGDFGAIIGDILYDNDEDIDRVIKQVSPGYIDRQRAVNDAEGRPIRFAVRPKAYNQTAEQVQEFMLYPTPDDAYDLVYHYNARFAELSATNLYALGGQAHRDTILQSCRDVATQFFRDSDLALRQREHEMYLERLQASVEFDRRNSPAFLGYNNEGTKTTVVRHGHDFFCAWPGYEA